jgi:hypothetical protein
MRTRLQIFILFVFFLVVGVVGYIFNLQHGGYDAIPKMRLTSDKANYQPGDNIELIVHFDYRGGQQLRLFKNISKSARMRVVEPHDLNNPTKERAEYFKSPPWDQFMEGFKNYTQQDIEEIYSKLPLKIERKIKGKFYQEGGKNIVKFDNYGSFEIKDTADVSINLYFYPIKPNPLDPLENYTSVEVQFQLPQKAQLVGDDDSEEESEDSIPTAPKVGSSIPLPPTVPTQAASQPNAPASIPVPAVSADSAPIEEEEATVPVEPEPSEEVEEVPGH